MSAALPQGRVGDARGLRSQPIREQVVCPLRRAGSNDDTDGFRREQSARAGERPLAGNNDPIATVRPGRPCRPRAASTSAQKRHFSWHARCSRRLRW
jgi:hypothetical protein